MFRNASFATPQRTWCAGLDEAEQSPDGRPPDPVRWCPDEGARQLLAYVVVREIFTVMARGERYDAARFVAALQRLPALPDSEEAHA